MEDTKPKPAPLLLTERQAAEVLNLSVRTLFSLRHCNALPFVRIGGRVMYCPGDLQTWIDRLKSEPMSAGGK